MITVSILINGQPIMSRSAVNTERRKPNGQVAYYADDGKTVWHDPDLGAVALAHKLLDLIKENPNVRRHRP